MAERICPITRRPCICDGGIEWSCEQAAKSYGTYLFSISKAPISAERKMELAIEGADMTIFPWMQINEFDSEAREEIGKMVQKRIEELEKIYIRKK